jgi:Anticodon binding domain of tRNAs
MAFSKIVSIVCDELTVADNVSMKASEDHHFSQTILKSDVIVVCLGSTEMLRNFQLKLCKDLWNSGVAADLSIHELHSSQDEVLTLWRRRYLHCVIIRPKVLEFNGRALTLKSLNYAH